MKYFFAICFEISSAKAWNKHTFCEVTPLLSWIKLIFKITLVPATVKFLGFLARNLANNPIAPRESQLVFVKVKQRYLSG